MIAEVLSLHGIQHKIANALILPALFHFPSARTSKPNRAKSRAEVAKPMVFAA
jgi:hypothetical protein